jgi:predicted nucleotidyltransferase
MNKINLTKIAKKHGLSLILLFGSYVNGKMHSKSDFDIAILSKSELDLDEHLKLYSELSGFFSHKELDLVSLNHADPLLLKQILTNCTLLYGSNRAFAEFKIYAFKRYCDYKIYFDLEKRFVHQFMGDFAK